MPNISNILKSEFSRIARKESRAETLALKKSASSHRSDIAAMKRRIQVLEQQIRKLGNGGGHRSAAAAADDDAPTPTTRFSAKGLASQRRRLGLSAHDCALLVGSSAQSVYNWEEGKVRPRSQHLAAIAALKSMGKRQVAERLATLKPAAG